MVQVLGHGLVYEPGCLGICSFTYNATISKSCQKSLAILLGYKLGQNFPEFKIKLLKEYKHSMSTRQLAPKQTGAKVA